MTRRTQSLQLPIGGGADFSGFAEVAPSLQATYGLTPDRATHLVQRYGSKAADVAVACGPTDQPLAAATQYSRAEIAHLIRTEFVQNLSDLALRRTDLAISGTLSMQIIEALADVMAEVTPLAADQIAAQKTALIDELTTYHGVDAATLNTRNTERTAQCA